MVHFLKHSSVCSHFLLSYPLSNEEDVTAVTDSSGNTLRVRRDTNRMPVRVVAPDNQVRCSHFCKFTFFEDGHESQIVLDSWQPSDYLVVFYFIF